MHLEATVEVTKVQDTKSKDNSVTVTLQGTKGIVLENYDNGYDVDDTAEIKVTVKLGSMAAAKALDIDKYRKFLVFVLRPRDSSLQDFEEAMKQPVDKALDTFRGVVSDDTLDEIEGSIPEHILKKIV